MIHNHVRRHCDRLVDDRIGSGALEFAIVANVFILFALGLISFGQWTFTQQALQTAAQQTARCVAIGASACGSAASYAVSAASALGVPSLTTSGVTVVNSATTTTDSTACGPPSGDVFVKVTLSLAFTSPIAGLLPGQNRTIVAMSCYPVTGT